MNYIELTCKISPFSAEMAEILTAELANMGYESFVEQEDKLLAYITADLFNKENLSLLNILLIPSLSIEFTHKEIEQQNWNEVWEKNYFEPIIIEDQCVVRSSFHKEFPDIKYQITIDPKMAFGTGHHQTTSLMLKEILSLNLDGKSVLDMGCGTGILAILSAMRDAKDITAVDIDEWSYDNSIENMQLNNTPGIKVLHGDINVVENWNFDIIYANINKNVLLNDIPVYAKNMKAEQLLMLSGFYQSDVPDIDKIASSNHLKLIKQDEKENWMMLKYKKTQ